MVASGGVVQMVSHRHCMVVMLSAMCSCGSQPITSIICFYPVLPCAVIADLFCPSQRVTAVAPGASLC